MAIYNDGTDVTYAASADLSALQYYFVKLDSSLEVVACGANDEDMLGVLQNKPTAQGQEAEVRIDGVTKLKVNEAVAINQQLTPTSTGNAEVVDAAAEFVTARAMSAATAQNDIVTAQIVRFYSNDSDA
jgi:hypothetical protein